MAATSAALPALATAWWLIGHATLRRRLAAPSPATSRRGPRARAPAAILFDRDGTLVDDVPYNGDPARVRPVPGAAAALARLRAAGVPHRRRLEPERDRARAARGTRTCAR